METLLYGLLLRSGNDCAVAIAEYISGDLENFARKMNEKANSLNLQNTNFVTPHGLDAPNHYTTAYDLAILTNYALKNETFANIVNTKNTTINIDGYTKRITNTHELLGYEDGVYGVKTGFTGNAGRCLVTACNKNNLDIIIVVLGANTKKIRTTDTLNLISYIYNNFEMVDTSDFLETNFKFQLLDIQNSFQKAEICLKKEKNYIYPISKKNKKYELKIYILENQKAPLEANSKIGVVKFFANGNFLYENDIITRNFVDKISLKEYILYIFKTLNSMF